jgi:DNA-directed RNA polymerase specialized sigma24 family protein
MAIPMRTPEEAVELSSGNLGLIYAKMRRLGIHPGDPDFDDLFQVGWLGLYASCLTWDAGKGTLGTWADRPIGWAVLRARVLGHRHRVASLEAIGRELLDEPTADWLESPDRSVEVEAARAAREAVASLLDGLPELERAAVRLRCGLDDGWPCGEVEAAARLGRSITAARNAFSKGMRRLRIAAGVMAEERQPLFEGAGV